MGDTRISIRNYYPRTIEIDDADGNVATLPIRVRRFTVEQLQEFSIGWSRCQNRMADRLIARKYDGEEQEKNARDVFVISDAEIHRRRLTEMTATQLAEHERLNAEDETFISMFYAATITDHVWLRPDVTLEIEEDDGTKRVIKTGTERDEHPGKALADEFAGNVTTLALMTLAVQQENTLSAEQKKRLRSLFDLTRSSRPPTQTADGAVPVATAAPVDPPVSAASAGVTEIPEPILSGSIET
jgi:hypothetical protein